LLNYDFLSKTRKIVGNISKREKKFEQKQLVEIKGVFAVISFNRPIKSFVHNTVRIFRAIRGRHQRSNASATWMTAGMTRGGS
jgi:hypothetical protein